MFVIHASTNFARRQTVARNGDKFADALRKSEGRGQVLVRLADDTVVHVPGVRMDLAVKFEDFDSTESFLDLDMDKYDLVLGMPRLKKHEPWIDWRGKAIGASRPAVSDRALVSNVPTSVRDWGARDGRQGAYAPEEVLGVTDSSEDVAMSLATGRETKAHCQACGIAATASPNAESRRAVWALTVAVPGGTDQAGNIGPQAAEAAEESADGVSCVGNIGPQSETPPARPVEDQYHVFDGVSGRQVKADAVHLEALPEVSAVLNLEELSMKDFLA
ncbi:Pol protein, partial [Phytophthora palmivora]